MEQQTNKSAAELSQLRVAQQALQLAQQEAAIQAAKEAALEQERIRLESDAQV